MNDIRKKFETNSFVTLAELSPPKGTNTETFLNNAKATDGLVDAFLIPDIPNAIMRMSAFSAACLLQKNQMNSIIQLNCRDRNQLALQADMLGAYANGFDSLMIVQGEDPKTGDHHQAKGVFDVSLTELFRTAQGMSEGFDLAGMELDGSANFLVGASLELSSKISDRFQIKNTISEYMEAGVSFFVTQPVFNMQMLAEFYESVKDLKPIILPTILLLKSLGMARYMARNVSTVDIPPELIKRIQKSKDKNNECLNISRENIASLKELGLHGVVISTIGWEHQLPNILKK
ncbi:Methylenetetrahydrofolate reductase [Candidatus Magnetomorum sp. HK-1]|nr:Methylenetetrahydrofolate reductase [Candidatus Magnetomorum sp. HK-1]